MKCLVLYAGLTEPKEFDGLLEAFQHVVTRGKERSFLIKTESMSDKWEDGTKVFEGMRQLFV